MKQSTTHTHVGRSKTSGKNKSKGSRPAHWQTGLEAGLEAFTRLELMALLAVGALLFLLVVPLLAQGPQRSQAAVCLNNLRQLGRAIVTWNADHGAADPWRVDWISGGTRYHPSGLQNNLWFQFSWLTNELRTPRMLGGRGIYAYTPANA
jgi:competence protein ComGC